MHAVIVKVTINDPETALDNLRNRIVPRVKDAPGFVAGYWYGDGQTTGNATILLGSEDEANGLVEMIRQQPGDGPATIDDIQVHEVVAQA
jgi:hypothetical protein